MQNWIMRVRNMPKLEIKENKRLVLKNVIIKELRNITLKELDAEINKFTNYLQVMHVQSFGPIVLKSIGTKIHESGNVTFDYDVIVQAHNNMNYKNQFKVEKEHTCDHCAYVRFEGKQEDMQYAHSKLDLHFYENDLETNGIFYTVHVSNNPEHMVIDIFKPVVQYATL
jgi:hypothetical protein